VSVPADLREGRIVIVGASLARLRVAETLREEGFTGSLTVVGDEPHPPYDRPPLSKQVLLGRVAADATGPPMRRDPDAEWRLGARATGLDPVGKRVLVIGGGFTGSEIASACRERGL
jgi:3-phenylpropionate/trans-cinnamate dioxygenase ferredoxin reductase component